MAPSASLHPAPEFSGMERLAGLLENRLRGILKYLACKALAPGNGSLLRGQDSFRPLLGMKQFSQRFRRLTRSLSVVGTPDRLPKQFAQLPGKVTHFTHSLAVDE